MLLSAWCPLDPPAAEPRLTGPNGLPIRCWGEERQQLCFGGHTFKWSFLRADVSFTILGVDLMRANKLLVDVTANTLVDSSTGDQFSLTGQPSGYTASIMLPANMATRGAMPPSKGQPAAHPGGHLMPPLLQPQQHRAPHRPPQRQPSPPALRR